MEFETLHPFLTDSPNNKEICHACVRLILRKIWVDGFTGPQRKVEVRYEFGLKVVLKSLGYKWRLLQPFLIEFPSNNQICYCFCQIDIAKIWCWQF